MKFFVRYELDKYQPSFGKGVYKNKKNITVDAEDRNDALDKAKSALIKEGWQKFYIVDCVRLKDPV